jgi:uncharacterized protein YndB with AHSA1/START domain
VRFRLDRSFVFEHAPAVVWDALSRPQDYPRWWTWLRRIDIDGDGLTEGTTAHCYVRAPIPFALRVTLHVERVDAGRRVEVRIAGDLEGSGSLELADHTDGTCARLTWAVQPAPRLLRAAGWLARPALHWGQEWAVSTGAKQFRHRGLPN